MGLAGMHPPKLAPSPHHPSTEKLISKKKTPSICSRRAESSPSFPPSPFCRLLIGVFQLQSSKDIFRPRRTHAVTPLAAVQMSACLCRPTPTPSHSWQPNNGLKPNHNKQRAQGGGEKKRTTRNSDFPTRSKQPNPTARRMDMGHREGSSALVLPHCCFAGRAAARLGAIRAGNLLGQESCSARKAAPVIFYPAKVTSERSTAIAPWLCCNRTVLCRLCCIRSPSLPAKKKKE